MWGNRNCPSIIGMEYTWRDLRQQLAQAQHVVMDLQHQVHYLHNQLHLILNKEDEDPEMLVEDDGQDEDELIFDLDSSPNEDQRRLVTSMLTRCKSDK